jgi:hypothetical protein
MVKLIGGYMKLVSLLEVDMYLSHYKVSLKLMNVLKITYWKRNNPIEYLIWVKIRL